MYGTLKIMDASGHRLLEVHERRFGAPEGDDARAQVVDADAAAQEFRHQLERGGIAFLIGTEETPKLPLEQQRQVKTPEDFDPKAHYLLTPPFAGG